jgi:hypothetical protein
MSQHLKAHLISIFGVVATISALNSCKPRQVNEAKLNRAQYSQAKASEMALKKCQNITNLTSKNLCFLDEYARQLLSQTTDYDDISNQVSEKLRRRGIQKSLPMSVYSIAPKSGGTCFSSDSNPVEAENFWNNQVEPIRKQIENVAEFLAQYHLDVDGQDPGPFAIKDVELCPITITQGRKIALHGSTLTIGLPVKGVISKTYGWYSFIELRQMWDAGDIFERTYSIKQTAIDLFAGKKTPFVWILANPVGSVRSSLRQLTRNQGGELLTKLSQLKSSESKLAAQDRAKTLRSTLNLEPNSEENKRNFIGPIFAEIQPEIEQILNSERNTDLVDEWHCQAEYLTNSSDISNAALGGLVERGDTTNVNYDIKASWVAVANFHNINVDVLGVFSNHSRFIESPRSSNQNFNFQVKAEGKVVVVTGDQVNVSTALNALTASMQRSVYTESLYHAVRNVSKVPDKSQWCIGRK